jgi:thiol-disulfide isomerase/thioredoxin
MKDKDQAQSQRKSPINHTEYESHTRYYQLVGIIIVSGFLIIGTTAGTYPLLKDLMEAPCLGCLGLYPNVDLDFTFDTVSGKAHPDFVLDALENKGPVFIEYTQNDENCPPCARMRPKVEALEKKYSDKVVFFIINLNEHEMSITHKDDHSVVSSHSQEKSFNVYDTGKISGGIISTPTYVIITLDRDTDGKVKPSFTVGYGEFEDNDAEKTKSALDDALEYAIPMYHHYYEMYLSQK